jgi:hypothetical protein
LFYFYQILTAFNNLKISVRACPSTKYGQLSTIWRCCQSLFFYQIRTGSVFSRSRTSSDKNLRIVEGGQYLVEVEQALTKSSNCWRRSVFRRGRRSSEKNLQTIWRFLSELVLLLSSDRLQQFEDFC